MINQKTVTFGLDGSVEKQKVKKCPISILSIAEWTQGQWEQKQMSRNVLFLSPSFIHPQTTQMSTVL